MRFAVTGGRDYQDYDTVVRALEKLPEGAVMVNGAARGADSLAATVWRGWGGPVEEYPADWSKLGRAAGHARNREMLNSGIDLLIAFPGGKGTENMVDICFKAKVPVVQVGRYSDYPPPPEPIPPQVVGL
jgi:predicted polyphosphate/ATP-dependent NAD kinase